MSTSGSARVPVVVHVVEDDESSRIASSRVLKSAGYVVRVYATGDDFLAQLPTEAGCIVLDLRLPQDRIPDAARDLVDVFAPVVHEEHVEIAPRRELRSPVAAHGHERDAALVAEELGEPTIGETRQGLTESQAPEGLVRDDRLAFFAKSRRGPSRRCGHG